MQHQQVKDANDAYKSTLKDILSEGIDLQAEKTLSTGSEKKFKEILNHHFLIDNPVERLLHPGTKGFNLPGAIARFVWMMAANNRLADIEFYWGNKVTPFSDDGYTVPGSSYGARMFNASPGLDQIEAVIKRLKEDKSTRRGAVSIYHPIDAIRKSKDIPCTFGVFYHIREGKLVSTIIMRSNNAFILLPYNVFEFSLLAEVIAKEVGVEMGQMHYHTLSMHVYEEHYDIAKKIVDTETLPASNAFPPMPFQPNPLNEVKKLIRLEAKIRHISAGLNNANIDEWLRDSITIDKEELTLDPYWRQFYYLLLYHIVSNKTLDKDALRKVADRIDEPFKKYLNAEDLKVMSKAIQTDLFGNGLEDTGYLDYSHATRRIISLEAHCDRFNEQGKLTGKVIDLEKYLTLRKNLLGDLKELKNIAARNESPEIAEDVFEKAANELFGNG